VPCCHRIGARRGPGELVVGVEQVQHAVGQVQCQPAILHQAGQRGQVEPAVQLAVELYRRERVAPSDARGDVPGRGSLGVAPVKVVLQAGPELLEPLRVVDVAQRDAPAAAMRQPGRHVAWSRVAAMHTYAVTSMFTRSLEGCPQSRGDLAP
jgi:hypothetical protein